MPVVHPAELWKETGRWYQIDAEMGRFKDRNGRDMVLAMTHEEVVADLVRNEIRSYRQLPAWSTISRPSGATIPRPRAGLIRVREFTMKDSYSLDADWEGLDRQYRAHYQAYFNIFHRCGLPVIAVQIRCGHDGRQAGARIHVPDPHRRRHPAAVRCLRLFRQPPDRALPQAGRPPKPPCRSKKSPRPDAKTIADSGRLPGCSREHAPPKPSSWSPPSPRAKTTTDQAFVFAIVRGDMEVNETKLANALKASELRPATEEEIRAAGAVPGYASPVGLSGSRAAGVCRWCRGG